ncbi:MAG: hypothetical protein O3C40_06030, partial [Planctomycetota bacterium]|nr:hypothetical protein [Planctomycetota bacterium]
TTPRNTNLKRQSRGAQVRSSEPAVLANFQRTAGYRVAADLRGVLGKIAVTLFTNVCFEEYSPVHE